MFKNEFLICINQSLYINNQVANEQSFEHMFAYKQLKVYQELYGFCLFDELAHQTCAHVFGLGI